MGQAHVVEVVAEALFVVAIDQKGEFSDWYLRGNRHLADGKIGLEAGLGSSKIGF